jgi:phosphoribosylformylglycinamidine (FGAM) synthase-like enzyme
MYSAIDAYHMTACTIDEAVRRLIAVGGDPGPLGGVDNFCWPNIQYDPEKTRTASTRPPSWCGPAGRCGICAWPTSIPLLSGKDSMYVDGHLPGRYGRDPQGLGAGDAAVFGPSA